MKTYTVLLMYPDYLAEPHYGEATYMWVGEAHDAGEACACAQDEAHSVNLYDGSEGPDDFAHVITFEGACEQVARHGCIYEDPPPRGMVLEDLIADESEFRCTGCGRSEDDCSRDPCADVIADRGDDPQQSITFSWFDESDSVERAYRSTQP